MTWVVRILGGAAVVVGVSAPAVAAETWIVPDDFVAIQEAIDYAAGGDTILVRPGGYVECLLIAGKSLRIASLGGPALTVIEGWAPTRPDTLSVVLAIAAESFVLDGFTVRRGSGGSTLDAGSRREAGGGVYFFASGGALRNCVIEDNVAGAGGGIYAFLSSAVFENCTVRGNEALTVGGGIMLAGSPVIVRECAVRQNTAPSGGGIACLAGAPRLDQVLVVHNGPPSGESGVGGGVFIFEGLPEITNCTIARNRSEQGCALWVRTDNPPVVTGCIVAFNEGGSEGLFCLGARPRVECSDMFQNGSSDDWCGTDAGGNLSADPLLCADYSIADRSPCAPAPAPPGCGLIGALAVGCAGAIEPATWGRIKAEYGR
jgi:Right handed beta helix region